MKKTIIIGIMACSVGLFFACNNSGSNSGNNSKNTTANKGKEKTQLDSKKKVEKYDPNRGEGKFHDYDPGHFDPALAKQGSTIYHSKCYSCHKLTDERLVGPGWKGVTKKHSATWILNFLTNTDAMLDKDPELQEQLEICMVRMPNQNLSDEEAKEVYAFMRQNDGAGK